jgi:large subunit ribosomal protein L37Ae
MAKLKLLGSTGRFGVRYGQSAKRKTADVEDKQRKKQKCIFCNGKAKRLSKGIWKCKKCGKKFAGHAYFLEEQIDLALVSEKREKTEKQEKAFKDKSKVLKKENTSLENKEEAKEQKIKKPRKTKKTEEKSE